MKIIFYSTGCPRCTVLKAKLDQKHIDYKTETNVNYMLNKNIKTVPVLEVDGELLQFTEAVKWINARGE